MCFNVSLTPHVTYGERIELFILEIIMSLDLLKKVLTSIEFWIIIFVIAGLENITVPPLDEHGWRQTLTLGIAKNFYEIDWNIFYPRTILGGSTTGIMACEFPIYNYLLAIMYKLFGFQDWYGRLVNWLVAGAGLYYYNQIIVRLTSKWIGFYATLMFMTSITFQFARKTMPDTFSLFVLIIGTYVSED